MLGGLWTTQYEALTPRDTRVLTSQSPKYDQAYTEPNGAAGTSAQRAQTHNESRPGKAARALRAVEHHTTQAAASKTKGLIRDGREGAWSTHEQRTGQQALHRCHKPREKQPPVRYSEHGPIPRHQVPKPHSRAH